MLRPKHLNTSLFIALYPSKNWKPKCGNGESIAFMMGDHRIIRTLNILGTDKRSGSIDTASSIDFDPLLFHRFDGMGDDGDGGGMIVAQFFRSEEHTSELQSQSNLL